MSDMRIPGAAQSPTNLAAAANPKSKIQNPKLLAATRQMEGYFVGALLKKMHESASKSSLTDESSESATFREMFDEAVGQEIGKRGSFGLADALYKELAGRQQATAPTPPGAAAGSAPPGVAAVLAPGRRSSGAGK